MYESRSCSAKRRQDGYDVERKYRPDVGQYLSDAVATSAKHGEDGVTKAAFER